MIFQHLQACFIGLFFGLALSAAALAHTQIGDDLIGELENDLFGSSVALSADGNSCLLYTSPSPRDRQKSRMPSSA